MKVNLIQKIIAGFIVILALGWAGSDIAAQFATPANPTIFKNPYNGITIAARAAVVYDPEKHEVLFAHNAFEALPLASITKVMTALVAREGLSPWSEVTIDSQSLATEGDSGLAKNELWKAEDLIRFTLVSSSNDGASALAAAVGTNFVDQMNGLAQKIGLQQTKFNNPTGLDLAPGQGGAYGSAYDVAKLFSYTLVNHPEVLAATAAPQISLISDSRRRHVASNTNILAANTPGLFASKTGFTDAAGGNLAVAIDLGLRQPVVVVVLGSTEEERFSDINKLVEATAKYYDSLNH